MANGLAILLMFYLLSCRRKNRESIHAEDKVYDGIAIRYAGDEFIVLLTGADEECVLATINDK